MDSRAIALSYYEFARTSHGINPPQKALSSVAPVSVVDRRRGFLGGRLRFSVVAQSARRRRDHARRPGTAVQAVYATGTVEAEDRVTVKAKTQGNIVEMKVREGAVVHRGDLIARIDSPTLRFELERGRSELWAANSQASQDSPQLASLTAQAAALETQRAQAHDDVVRLEQWCLRVRQPKVISIARATPNPTSSSQIAAIDAQKRALRIDLAAHAQTSASSVDSLAARLKDTEVRSPLDGVVLAKLVEPDEVVTINEPLFRVGDTRKLILECPIDEADIAHVQLGADVAVSLYAFGDTIFAGTVFEILPDADRQKKSFLAKVRLTKPPEGLRSGMTAEVNIITARHPNVLLAPADAVSTDNEVWVVREARARKIRIDIGIRDLLARRSPNRPARRRRRDRLADRFASPRRARGRDDSPSEQERGAQTAAPNGGSCEDVSAKA